MEELFKLKDKPTYLFFISAELRGEKTRGKTYRTTTKVISYVWKHTFAKLGEDWVFLGVLGIVMAIISFIMDYGIGQVV